MKRNIILALILNSMIFLSSCVNNEPETVGCDPSIQLGTLAFEDRTNGFFPTPTHNKWFLENGDGEIIEMTTISTNIEQDVHLNIELLCEAPLFDYQFRYYESKYCNLTMNDGFGNSQNHINFSKAIRAIENELPEKEFFFDSVTLSGKVNGAEIGYTRIIPAIKEGQEEFPSTFVEETEEGYTFHESIELDGVTYENVYATMGEGTAYLNDTEGFIGATDAAGTFWKLQ